MPVRTRITDIGLIQEEVDTAGETTTIFETPVALSGDISTTGATTFSGESTFLGSNVEIAADVVHSGSMTLAAGSVVTVDQDFGSSTTSVSVIGKTLVYLSASNPSAPGTNGSATLADTVEGQTLVLLNIGSTDITVEGFANSATSDLTGYKTMLVVCGPGGTPYPLSKP